MDQKIVTATNRANVERSDAFDHPGREYAKDAIIRGALALKPLGLIKHQGSFALHMYVAEGTTDFMFICQTVGLHDIPEAQVDVGLKELRRQLMGLYGRDEKSRNKI